MRKIIQPVPGAQYANVLAKAQTLKQSHIAEFEQDPSAKIKTTDHYRAFKELLLENQYDKCAYCECAIENQPGDVEHYRPKGRVTEVDGKPVTVTLAPNNTRNHPGYFWLAYDVENLMMSCADCNRARYHKVTTGEDPQKAGKADSFPIGGERAFRPADELDKELPELLNPQLDEPEQHLDLDQSGLLVPKSKRGEETIRLLGLNTRENLCDARRLAYWQGKNLLTEYWTVLTKSADPIEIEVKSKEFYHFITGRSPYSLAYQRGYDVTAKRLGEQLVRPLEDKIRAEHEGP